ncbi:DUF5801 domain-containing protein, partial [Rhodobacteraceae bacterium KMM 6894]|nr:DUF5801 domain-containing protein [Rhodobacteraceae bacterium KMM 6894]
LAQGQTATDTFSVLVDDGNGGTDTQVVTITITGTNDEPEIRGTATGAVSEDTVETATGTLIVSDVDASEFHVWSLPGSPGSPGVYGFLNVEQDGDWTYVLDNDLAVVQNLAVGETLTDTITVRVTDRFGAMDDQVVTITITGTNDAPVAQDDLSLTAAGTAVTNNVLINDSDGDNGDTTRWSVSSVDGQAITAGSTITLSGGRGTVSMSGAGELTYTPGAGFTGQLVLPYVVNDGSGAGNATATADWTINVAGVDIVDDASVSDPSVGENVLASIDNLQEVAINGQVPAGGAIASLKVSDGTNTVTLPANAIVIAADGSFTVNGDLSGLSDGTLTVSLQVVDTQGNSVTTTDTILKDTVTTVSVDPVVVVNGEVPEITGTGEPGATVTVTIPGEGDTDVTVGNDGTWTHTPTTPLSEGEVTLSVSAVDMYGNTANDTGVVSGLTLTDTVAGQPEHITVYEAALPAGTTPTETTESAQNTLIIGSASNAVDSIIFGGSISGGAIVGGTAVTLAQLEAVSTTPITPIATDYGTLTITAYDAATGTVTYTYAIDDSTQDHDNAAGVDSESDQIADEIGVAVLDTDGDIRVDTLVVAIVDDVPAITAGSGDPEIEVSDATLATNETVDFSTLFAVDHGADGGATSNATQYALTLDGAVASGLVDTASDEAVVLSVNAAGTVVTGTADGETVMTFTVDPATGQITLDQQRTVKHAGINTADDTVSITDGAISLQVTAVDGDGDTVSDSTTIGDRLIFSDDTPTTGTTTDGTISETAIRSTASASITNTINASLGADQVGGSAGIIFDTVPTIAALKALDLKSGGNGLTFSSTDTTVTGTADGETVFTISLVQPSAGNGYQPGYTFALSQPLDHLDSGGNPISELDLEFDYIIEDADGDTATNSFTVNVADDIPPPTLAYNLDEDNATGITFDTSADASRANTILYDETGLIALLPVVGGDGNTYATLHGTVTIGEDGSITYVAAPNYSGEETFLVRTNDGNSVDPTEYGETEVTVTVAPVADAATIDVDAAQIGTLEDTAVSLGLQAPAIADNATGVGNNPISERIGAVTLSGIPSGATLLDALGSPLLDSLGDPLVITGGSVDIILNDVLTEANATGQITMSSAQYETLQILPPADSSTNFTLTTSVTSYEVDATGEAITGVSGAPSTVDVEVFVEAVTDQVELAFNDGLSAVDVGVDELDFTGTTLADVTIKEDTNFSVRALLEATLHDDLDGSEIRAIRITNNSGQTILTGTGALNTLTDGSYRDFSAKSGSAGQTGDFDSFRNIKLGGIADFSGDLNGITIEIIAYDTDADGYLNGGAVVSGPVDVADENTPTNNIVTLNLHVTPIAGEVVAGDIEADENETVNLLQHVAVTDAEATNGAEVITKVTFDPDVWVVTAPSPTLNAAVWSTSTAGSEYTIEFTAGTEAEREAVLDAFSFAPPAAPAEQHTSTDTTIDLKITTNDGTTTTEVTRPVTVTVTPVAEVIGTDTNADGTDDLTMGASHIYATDMAEDTWFNLNSEAGFNLIDGWENEDPDEATYARLTPETVEGAGAFSPATGTEFRWSDGGSTVTKTFNGTAIDVPIAALGSLEIRTKNDFSGEIRIKIEAYTVDYDDDTEAGAFVDAVSGEEYLTNLNVLPVADQIALSLNAVASGLEDNAIPLVIRPSSSDPSETFTITISDIPVGAVLNYGGTIFTATAGNTSFEIEDFQRATDFKITPPADSNANFTLQVSAVSVDPAADGGAPSVSAPVTHSVNVAVRGVADPATVEVETDPAITTFVEETLDNGGKIMLADLVEVSLNDTDGSEALTMRVSGFPEGFSPNLGTLVTGESVTGAARIWVLTPEQLDVAEINVPDNYSGTVTLQVVPVTTENDGNSLTDTSYDVSFSVTPSPEASVTTSAVLVEDELGLINFDIVHQRDSAGQAYDTDEKLGDVRISIAEADFHTLSLGVGAGSVTLADALIAGDITSATDAGVDYYVLTGDQAKQLAALGGAHLDGDLGGFTAQYQIIDDSYGAIANAAGTPTDPLFYQDQFFGLSATPVTDPTTLAITSIAGTLPTTTATPTDATLSAADTLTVTLNVDSNDFDGSEKLIRFLMTDVPPGVIVTDAEFIGAGSWLLVYDPNDHPINANGGIAVPIEFQIGTSASGSITPITITSFVQDRAEVSDVGTGTMSDSVSWTLDTLFTQVAGGEPAEITTWEYTGAGTSEDPAAPFPLSDMITAAIAVNSTTAENVFTVVLRDVPEGTEITGMSMTMIDNKPVWSASKISTSGMSEADIEGLLATLMDSIQITPPENWNDNHNLDEFTFDATLNTALLGSTDTETKSVTPVIPIEPDTDEATLTLTPASSVPASGLDESATDVPLTITITNPADGLQTNIVDGELYLKLTTPPGMETGTMTVDGTTYTSTDVSGVDGITDGDYYVIPGVSVNDTLVVSYEPTAMVVGDVVIDAFVRNFETGDVTAPTQVTSAGQLTMPISVSNEGVIISSDPIAAGDEVDSEPNNTPIKLTGLSVTLNDTDGSEEIDAILLTNLPDGFLVLTGANAADAALAELSNNAGGGGGKNSWILASGNDPLPAYIAILPPAYWSGTLNDLSLVVISGETSLDKSRADIATISPITVNPVADGVELTTSTTFGKEGDIVPLNLNISVIDSQDASVEFGGSVVAQDANVETATIQLTGLGEFAALYIDGVLVDPSDVTYTANPTTGGTYELSGLTQDQLDGLGFRQANSALVDFAGTAGTQIGVTAWTMDGTDESAHVDDVVTLDVTPQSATTGDNSLIWTGNLNLINGLAGTDTVQLRYGESLTGGDLATNLSNIEVLDLTMPGANDITALTPEDIEAMSDDVNEVTINGTADDTVELSGIWTDNGDGTYTGTIGVAPNESSVELTVSGGVTVTEPAGGFYVPVVAPLFSTFMMSADDGFGLSALRTFETAAEPDSDKAADGDDADLEELPTLDALLGAGAPDSLDDLLPEADEEDTPENAPAVADSGTGDFIPDPAPTTLWDEPQDEPSYS